MDVGFLTNSFSQDKIESNWNVKDIYWIQRYDKWYVKMLLANNLFIG